MADAEEDVPPYVMDHVFAEMDRKKKAVIPLWLKWTAAGLSSAAALALGIFLWQAGNPHKEEATDSIGTAIVQNGKPSLYDTPEMVDDSSGYNYCSPAIAEDVPGMDEEEIAVMKTDVPEGNGLMAEAILKKDVSANSGKDADPEIKSIDRQADSKLEETGAGQEESVDPFSIEEEDLSAGRKSRVAITVGGDISSNGNPGSLNMRRGFFAPPSVIQEATYIEQTSKNSSYSIPVSFGMSARLNIGRRWGIGAGLNYSMLQRTFTGTYTKISGGKTVKRISSDIRHAVHYIGIPVNAYYDIIQGSRLKLYAYAGGSAERGIANVYRIKNSPKDITYKDKIKGIQLSAGGGIGIEFKIVDGLGIYVNPGIRYYFDCDQPVSIRTQQPLMMNFEIGLKVDI